MSDVERSESESEGEEASHGDPCLPCQISTMSRRLGKMAAQLDKADVRAQRKQTKEMEALMKQLKSAEERIMLGISGADNMVAKLNEEKAARDQWLKTFKEHAAEVVGELRRQAHKEAPPAQRPRKDARDEAPTAQRHRK